MRFFSPPEKPTLTGRLSMSGIDVQLLRRLAHRAHEIGRRQIVLAARACAAR